MMVGCGLVAWFEWRNKSIHSVRDCELWLKLPVLGVVPEFEVGSGSVKKTKGTTLTEGEAREKSRSSPVAGAGVNDASRSEAAHV